MSQTETAQSSDDRAAAAIYVDDDLAPEDLAMLQALYSRSGKSSREHLARVRSSGSGKFMTSHYVGYNHKSIGDCGSTTLFLENVSILAAKAVQDWPLYSGQETSTRYLDMAARPVVDPVDSAQSRKIVQDWVGFYAVHRDRVVDVVRARHQRRDGEDPATYERAVAARAFDILRGFLPAGMTTQLSWHTNLRQARDHLTGLSHHPAHEIARIAERSQDRLDEKYPSSGFAAPGAGVSGARQTSGWAAEERRAWEAEAARQAAYPCPTFLLEEMGPPGWRTTGTICDDGELLRCWTSVPKDLPEYADLFASRPRGCVLPHFLSDLGQCQFRFSLDFGSFRDVQRHRNGVCRMPLLTTHLGFEPWYLDQLDDEGRREARSLVAEQVERLAGVTDDPVARQYLTALGFRVPVQLTYGLPATVYVLELRSQKTIHPTLCRRVHAMGKAFQDLLPSVAIHVDADPDDWDVRRGDHTILERTTVKSGGA